MLFDGHLLDNMRDRRWLAFRKPMPVVTLPVKTVFCETIAALAAQAQELKQDIVEHAGFLF
jgi:hypothetical protein